MRIRTYSELRRLRTFEDRFEYLNLAGVVGASTFGFDRWLNQRFYGSREWKSARDEVIVRDGGCDLGIEGYEIFDRIIIHHMNPMTEGDISSRNADILDPEYLITVTHDTHNAIHYGDFSLVRRTLVERRPGDTRPW